MKTLTEQYILKSRTGVYQDTAENRRLHRVGQHYGSEKKNEEPEHKGQVSKEAHRGGQIFSKMESSVQKELMDRYRKESEKFLEDGQSVDVVIGNIEEYLTEDGFKDDSKELSEKHDLPIKDAEAVVRFLAEVEMIRLRGLDDKTKKDISEGD